MSSKSKLGFCAFALLLSVSVMHAASSEVGNAARTGNRSELKELLAKKADVNAPLADGSTAIQWAVYNDDLEMADMLIAAGANVKTPNLDGATPLSLACTNGDAAMIGKLLNAGADPNERLSHGETALMMASKTGSVDAMKVLLDHGADVNAKETLRGTTALMWAAQEQQTDAVKVLLGRGADVNAGDAVIVQKGARPRGPGPTQTVSGRLDTGKTATEATPAAAGKGAAAARVAPVANPNAARIAGAAGAAKKPAGDDANDDAGFGGGGRVGRMTALDFAALEGDLDTARVLVAAKANVNQPTVDGWTPLTVAVQNRNYKLAAYLLDQGADPNIPTGGGWTPLYLATDNRNIDGGEYPVRSGDMDHLDFIKLLLAHGADVNARIKDHTETRTNFTGQWLNEDGATPFLRGAHSGDLVLMKLLLDHGADPKIPTRLNVTALEVASGIGWVEGITYQWSPAQSLEAVKLLYSLGLDVNNADNDGRTALIGSAHKGQNDIVQFLADHGAKLDAADKGSAVSYSLGRHWMAVDWADGLVRVGVQSAIAHPETAALLRKLMKEQGLPDSPPRGGTACITDVCK